MLHHRFNSNTTSTSHSSGIGPSKSAPPSNKTYTPLRRQSSGLYATPQSGTKVRYPMPSPNLTPYADGSPLPVYPSYPSSNGGYGVPDGPELSIQGNNPVLAVVRHGLDGLRLGLADAARLDRSWSLVWSDHELRSLVIKSTLINLLSLLLLSLWPLIFSPIFSTSTTSAISPTMQDKTREISMWYNLLLSWPVFIVCFWINASWSPDITRRAHTLLHPSYRFQPSPSPTPTSAGFSQQSNIESFVSNPIGWLMPSLTRITMISDFTLLTRIMCMIPTLGRWSAMGYMCIINSYYFFESTFLSRSWGLDHRISFMQERIGYMIGFGLPATVLTSFGPPLVNMVIFALIYPFFVIQALQSRPPQTRQSLFPTPPSPHISLPPSPSLDPSPTPSNPFFSSSSKKPIAIWDRLQVPIFFFARYALRGLAWFELALGRDRRRSVGLGERPGKRLM